MGKVFLYSFLATMVFCTYQNCSGNTGGAVISSNQTSFPGEHSSHSSFSSQEDTSTDTNEDDEQLVSMEGNGVIYSGKVRYVFVSDYNCDDGTRIVSEINLFEGAYFIVKKDCDKIEHTVIPTNKLIIHSEDSFTYNSQVYISMAAINPNDLIPFAVAKDEFVWEQFSSKYCTVGAQDPNCIEGNSCTTEGEICLNNRKAGCGSVGNFDAFKCVLVPKN